MQTPPITPNEHERLAVLASYDILDTPPEPAFDRLTKMVAHILQVPIALVSLVDVDRQWFKSRYGIDVEETPRDVSFCGHVVALDRPLVVPDALLDERFADNPLVTAPPHVRFYAGYPLRTLDGLVLGTLCVIDSKEHEICAQQLEMLELLTNEVMIHLELRRKNRLLLETLTKLHDSQEGLVQVLNQLQIGVIIVDANGSVGFASEKYCPALQVNADVVVGMRWENVLDLEESTCRKIRATMRRPEDKRTRIDFQQESNDGIRWMELDLRDDPRQTGGHIFYLYDVSEIHALRARLNQGHLDRMIGDSAAMRQLYETIGQVAAGNWTALIEGETGTGKELVAKAIHHISVRRNGPFIAVNCAGLTESILGSQLFGHVQGAFTGASSNQTGLFEAAAGGSLFLDEIGDVSMPIQNALLRALQEKEVTRLGETRPRKVDVRIIAATNRDLHKRVAEGSFREDLLYRIRNARIFVPPLRKRREDIPLLVASFLAEERLTCGKLITDISTEAMQRLMEHQWPGNVRELRGVIEYAVIRCRTRCIEVHDLPHDLVESKKLEQKNPVSTRPDPQFAESKDERTMLIAALKRTGGNRARTARILQIGRATLYRRLLKLNITDADLQGGDEDL